MRVWAHSDRSPDLPYDDQEERDGPTSIDPEMIFPQFDQGTRPPASKARSIFWMSAISAVAALLLGLLAAFLKNH